MKQFFKFIFASCLGTLIALALIVVVIMSIGVGATKLPHIGKNSVLHLKLDEFVPELTGNVQQSTFSYSESNFTGLNDLRRLIELAGNDDKIAGILLQTENPQVRPATAIYIHDLIREFSNSGKFVHAFGNYFSQSGYIIALAADSLFMDPNGVVDLRGYGMVIPYFKQFSEKTGIGFEVYHAGKYKSAVEPYYRGESSEENRYQAHKYLDSYQQALIYQISEGRKMDRAVVENIINNGLSQDAEDAIQLNLVDDVLYYQDYEERLKEAAELSEVNLVSLDDYLAANPKNSGDSEDKIAIVYAEGEIAHSGELKGTVNMDIYGDILDRIRKNNKIKAVVLRVNSPGGSSVTSDQIWRKIEDLKAAGKYVVASFGDYAASGGYYIACGADKIICEPTSLTGSIGVFSMMPNMRHFFDDKLGIYWDTIGTGNHTFLYSLMVDKSPADNRLLQSQTEKVYGQFKNRVSSGRKMDPEQVEEIAQGRVWTGDDAAAIGLVDSVGTLNDAINVAAEATELDDYKILEYPIIKKSFVEELMTELVRSAETRLLFLKHSKTSKLTAELAATIDRIEEACSVPQTRMYFSNFTY